MLFKVIYVYKWTIAVLIRPWVTFSVWEVMSYQIIRHGRILC